MKKFDYSKTLVIGFGFLAITLIGTLFNQYVPIFLQAGNPEFEANLREMGANVPEVVGFGLAPSLALFMMTWDNLINVFIQPWVGERSDRTWSRFGRRKPWILLGTPVALLGFVLLPFAPTALALAVFILITNFGLSLFRSPTVAWLGDLFIPEERSKANGVINLMGGIGGVLAFVGGGPLFDGVGRAAPFWAGAILVVVATGVILWRVAEPEQIVLERGEAPAGVLANVRTVWRNPNKSGFWVLLSILLWFMAYSALEAGLSSFAVFGLGLTPGRAGLYAGALPISFLLFAVPAGALAGRFGRRQTIIYGLTGLALFMFLGFFVIRTVPIFIVMMVVYGFCWALVNVNSLPLVYDFGDERKIGAYTGLYYFSSQLASVLGPTSAGLVVDLLGNQYRWLFIFGGLFMALAWLTMNRVGANKGQKAG